MIVKNIVRSSCCGSAETNLTSIHDEAGLIPGLAQGFGIPSCHELWCRSQMWLESCAAVAVAVANSSSSSLPPGLGLSICYGCGPKRTKKKDENIKSDNSLLLLLATPMACRIPSPGIEMVSLQWLGSITQPN